MIEKLGKIKGLLMGMGLYLVLGVAYESVKIGLFYFYPVFLSNTHEAFFVVGQLFHTAVIALAAYVIGVKSSENERKASIIFFTAVLLVASVIAYFYAGNASLPELGLSLASVAAGIYLGRDYYSDALFRKNNKIGENA